MNATGLLSGVRVVDCSPYEGMYGARLLADLGADVVRVEFSDAGAPLLPGPVVQDQSGMPLSAFELFTNLNKRSVTVDPSDPDQCTDAVRLMECADVILAGGEPSGFALPEGVARIDTSAFGHIGRGRELAGSDLVELAAGGLLSLGGYPDAGPVAVYGHQAYLCGGIMTAVAALLALISESGGSRAPHGDVSVQACLVGALEDATAEYELCGNVRKRAGDAPREAGTGIFRCSDGYVAMVAGKLGTAQAWTNLIEWLNEEDVEGAQRLADPEWAALDHRRLPMAGAEFTVVFERFTTQHTGQWLYREAQRRRIALAPVQTIAQVVEDPQLRFRNFFKTVFSRQLAADVRLPGRPYRLYDLPVSERWEICDSTEDVGDIGGEWAAGRSLSASGRQGVTSDA